MDIIQTSVPNSLTGLFIDEEAGAKSGSGSESESGTGIGLGGKGSPLSPCACCCGGTILITLMGLLFGSIAVVDPLSYGLLKNNINGRVDLTQVYGPGMYMVGFYRGFVLFPSTVSTIQYSYAIPEAGVQHVTPLFLRSSDAQPMHLELSVQYKRKQERLADLYKRAMTPRLQEDFFISSLRSELTKVMSLQPASACWQDRAALIAAFKTACDKVMDESFGVCWGLQFYRSHMSPKYEVALVNTQVQKQNKEIERAKKRAAEVRAITQVIVSNVTRAIQVIEATGAAERYNIEKGAVIMAEANKTFAQAKGLGYIRSNLRAGAAVPNDGDIVEYLKMNMMIGDLKEPQLFYGLNPGAKEYVLMPPGGGRRMTEGKSAAVTSEFPAADAAAATLPEL